LTVDSIPGTVAVKIYGRGGVSMNLRPGSLVVAIAILTAFAALSPSLAGAQQEGDCEWIPHCGPYVDDPPAGGGSGGGSTCATCVAVYVFPNLQTPHHYECEGGPPTGQTRLQNCSAHLNGCSSTGFCYIV
jgi:hypothetical protein